MTAVSIALLIFIVVGATAWVFFDATDRGKKYAWLWALAVFVTGWTGIVPLILLALYFGTRNTGLRREVAQGGAVRLYLIVAAFCSLVLAVVGASIALGIYLAHLVPNTLGEYSYRASLASAISAGIVGAILWWGHWRTLNRRLTACADDSAFRAMFSLRRTELLGAVFLFGAAAALAALVLLEGAVSALIHAEVTGATANWLPAVAPLMFAGFASWYHYAVYRGDAQSTLGARFHSIPPPPLVEPPEEPPPPASAVWPTQSGAPAQTIWQAAPPPASSTIQPPPETSPQVFIPAGWYPQPDGTMHYWTGKAWTDQVLQPH